MKINKKIFKTLTLTTASAAVLTSTISCEVVNKFLKDPSKQDNTNPGESTNKNPITPQSSEQYKKPEGLSRIGHWNILNFGGDKSTKLGLKVTAITETILKTDLDIVGLTEINYKSGDKVNRIVERLNESSSSKWKMVVQPIEDSNPNVNKETKEQIAILYKSELFEALPFSNSKIGASWGTQFGNDENNVKRNFKRPLFATLFKDIKKDKRIITVFGHLDSPGVKKGSDEENSSFKEQGTQEVFEARSIPKAFDYFSSLTTEPAAIVFGGDTNIKTKNQSLFDEMITKKLLYGYTYKNYLFKSKGKDPFEYYETSLGATTGYANTYDKMLFRENNTLDFITETEKQTFNNYYKNQHFKFDILSAYKDGVYNKQEHYKLWKQNYGTTNGISDHELIRTGISDHTLVWIDYK
ncbi:MnuA family membrane nuclease [Mycoplasma procyoni]|uniref:MnuA family membrane nuclease n=1 Tax=Mycoplasma procyoni TaxID=568784 RepID=UPI00197B5DCB|nr:hypothetical protein [Mycoplasma procyoni]MBN3534524.1 hypothetical protein [Mycoplasma procyoni]